MALFAIYDDGAFVAERDYAEKPVVSGKPYRKFYAVEKIDPAWNPATQVRTGPVLQEDHAAEIRRYVWTVRDKTAQELDGEKELSLDAYDRLSFLVNFDQENRIRALEGKAAITQLQYRNALKARL
jgi:hypothetical protein